MRCLVRVFDGGVVGVDGLRRGMAVVMNVVERQTKKGL
jgi:hypothetical protein